VQPPPQAPTRVPPPVQAQDGPPVASPEPRPARPAGQPAPPPRPAAMALDGPLTCEMVWSHWENVLDQLRVNVRAFLVEAVPTELSASA